MKSIRTFEEFINESVLNESNAKAKSLRTDYVKAWRGLEELDVDVIMNYDYPMSEFGDLFGNREALKTEFEEWMTGKGLELKDAWRYEREFLSQRSIIDRAKKAFKDKEKELHRMMDNAEKELFVMYPILPKIDKQMDKYSGGPVLAQKIFKSGKTWTVVVPGYDVRDIELTPEEVAELKKYIKDVK
jgi:hypothetical protein